MNRKNLACLLALASAASAQNFLDFDCVPLGVVPPLGDPGDCEGVTGVGAFIQSSVVCVGIPTTGSQCLVVFPETQHAFIGNHPSGAVLSRPLPTGIPEARLPMPAGTTIVGFDWRAFLNETGTPYNDGLDISVCDAAGNRLELIVSADAAAAGGFACLGFNNLVHSLSAPTPPGAYLSVCVFNEQDTCCGGTYLAIDRVRFSPGNDECVGAMPITGSVSGQSPFGASTSPGLGCGATNDRWYSFTSTRNGVHTFSTTSLGSYNPNLNVFASCGGANLGCNDDSGVGTVQASVSVTLVPGQTVKLSVGGFLSGASGTFGIDVAQPLGITFSSPSAGLLSISVSGGTPNSIYFAPMTIVQGAFPNGSFFGLDISMFDLFAQFAAGAPFLGLLDGSGAAQWGPYGPGLSGLSLYSVVLDDVGNPGFSVSTPASFTIP
jgi:hypothetical protein